VGAIDARPNNWAATSTATPRRNNSGAQVCRKVCGPNMIPVCSRSRQILPLMPSMSPLEMPRSIALMTPLEIDRDLWVMS
jgi:hypothetical protein